MAYALFEHDGTARIGELAGDVIIPLAGVTDLGPEVGAEALAAAERLDAERVAVADVRLRPIAPRGAKIFCVGLNYHAHVEETKRDLPEYPVLFPKYASSLIGPADDIVLPPESTQVDYEAELAVIIGRGGRRIPEAEALDHVLGYAVANDVTMRDYQYKTHQWLQGKAWDESTPVGPFIVTPDEVDVSRAGIRTILNGETLQDSDLSRLIFSIPRLIATVSEFTRLEPGDVILTGTPGGVGYRREPKVLLADGDVVTIEVDGVGSITNRVVAAPA